MIKIRELRKSKGVAQKDLAREIGVAQPTLSGWENGKTQVDYANLLKLADFFCVSLDELMGREFKTRNQTATANGANSQAVIGTLTINNSFGGISDIYGQLDETAKLAVLNFACMQLARQEAEKDK